MLFLIRFYLRDIYEAVYKLPNFVEVYSIYSNTMWFTNGRLKNIVWYIFSVETNLYFESQTKFFFRT